MEKTFKLKVPFALDDVSLKDYQKYVKVVDENKDVEDQNFLALKMLNIFCGISMKEAYELPVNQMDSVINHLAKILSHKSKLNTRFTMTDPKGKKVEFGQPELKQMPHRAPKDVYMGPAYNESKLINIKGYTSFNS